MGQDHLRYSEILVYQARLSENIANSRRYGDNHDLKSDRFSIIEQLNQLALSELGISFNELSGLVTSTRSPKQSPSHRQDEVIREVGSSIERLKQEQRAQEQAERLEQDRLAREQDKKDKARWSPEVQRKMTMVERDEFEDEYLIHLTELLIKNRRRLHLLELRESSRRQIGGCGCGCRDRGSPAAGGT